MTPIQVVPGAGGAVKCITYSPATIEHSEAIMRFLQSVHGLNGQEFTALRGRSEHGPVVMLMWRGHFDHDVLKLIDLALVGFPEVELDIPMLEGLIAHIEASHGQGAAVVGQTFTSDTAKDTTR